MHRIISGKLKPGLPSVAVIMAGGSGTRFWPLSRTNFPKQFLALTGTERSLIQGTADRLESLTTRDGIMVVTAENQTGLVREQLPHVTVLSEPTARNTAACIGYAATLITHQVGDVPMICMPADHMVWGAEDLMRILGEGVELSAKDDVVVTIGIRPSSPETGYGYIHRGKPTSDAEDGVYHVKRFVEKPDRATAQSYLDSGDYFWNSGMFVWRPSVILSEMKKHLPELSAGLDQIAVLWGNEKDPQVYQQISEIYSSLQSISIDFGVMEKSTSVVMMSGSEFRWSDVGSWSSWVDVELAKTGEHGNFTRGDVVLIDSERCCVLGQKGDKSRKLLAGVGLRDMIIVETEDAILVCHREQTQDVKKVVETLKANNRKELL